MCSASEQYQHEITSVLAGIEGAENISDVIVVHGPDTETHDNYRVAAGVWSYFECGEMFVQHGQVGVSGHVAFRESDISLSKNDISLNGNNLS